MDRLTFDGNFCDIAMCRELPCQHGNNCTQKQVWERLKHYEDTEVTPEDLKAPFTWVTITNMVAKLALGVEPGRLRELVEADKAGRLVVLPCNVGDTVYATFGNEVEERQVIEFDVVGCKSSGLIVRAILVADQQLAISARWDVSVGKYVFLTREEAEAALKGAKDGRC